MKTMDSLKKRTTCTKNSAVKDLLKPVIKFRNEYSDLGVNNNKFLNLNDDF